MHLIEMIEKIRSRHSEYIQAEYHLRNPRLLRERSAMMEDEESGTQIMAPPFLEAPPKYGTGGRKFSELDLPDEVKEILKVFSENNLGVFDPPYEHQSDALEAFFSEGKDLIVTTGTGSGKTEVFLYSILGHIAQEVSRGKTTDSSSIRSLVMYPMNALVSDQLTRMRGMFGRRENPKAGADDQEFQSPFNILRTELGRPYRFAMYTGRTQYHGQYDKDKNEVADMFTELDAIDEVYNDLSNAGVDPALIEKVEEAMHFNERLDYILTLIPDDVKAKIQ